MQPQAEGHVAECTGCGAALALAREGRARCLYCALEQPLPANLVAPLRELHGLSERVEQMSHAALSTAAIVIIGGAITLLLLPGLGILTWVSVGAVLDAEMEPAKRLLYGVLGLGSVLLVVTIPVLSFIVQSAARRRRLAALPTSVPVLEGNELGSACPRCGARHPPVRNRITATCTHCRTEALLPLPLVGLQFAALHRKVFRRKAHRYAELGAARDAARTWETRAVPILLTVVSLVFGTAMIIFFIMLLLR